MTTTPAATGHSLSSGSESDPAKSATPHIKTPCIALIGRNSLMMLGLKTLLEDIMPLADYRIYPNLRLMEKDETAVAFFHFFIEPMVFVEAPDFFSRHQHQTIILSDGENEQAVPRTFRRLNVLLPADELVKQLLLTYQHAHEGYRHYPATLVNRLKDVQSQDSPMLTEREKDVLILLAKGLINKQIATQLKISVNTVITHRRNIMQKLHSQSLPKLVIYAVTHNLVAADEII